MSHGKRYAILAGLAAVLATGGLVAYFSADSRAKEKPAAKGPGAVPVAVAAALQQSIPVRLQAIGNIEPYTSVAVKSRRSQIMIAAPTVVPLPRVVEPARINSLACGPT